MRAPVVALLGSVIAIATLAMGACNGTTSDSGTGSSGTSGASSGTSGASSGTSGGASGASGGTSGGTSGASGASGGTSGASGGADSGGSDATDASDASDASDAGGPGPGAVQFIGRFDTTDAVGPRTAWPGARIVARFDGTDVDVKLTQTDGFSVGPTYFNIIRDGAFTGTFSVTGTQVVRIASGLAAGPYTIEIEKRTEAPFGTVRFEGFTFAGGAGLLAPPARLARKLEFLGDSTIDGYGIDGSRTVGALNYCGDGLAPPNLNDVRKSVAWKTASGLGAELNVLGYSGKGIARNEDGQVLDLFPTVYTRALPDLGGNAWNFASFVPDVVVVSLGGSDYDVLTGTFPASFATKYADLVAYIRAQYGAAPYVFLTVWSQHKAYNGVRQAIGAAINAAIAGRPAGEKTARFDFPEADPDLDETGCQYHANPAHHTAMAALLVAEIKAVTGWP